VKYLFLIIHPFFGGHAMFFCKLQLPVLPLIHLYQSIISIKCTIIFSSPSLSKLREHILNIKSHGQNFIMEKKYFLDFGHFTEEAWGGGGGGGKIR
jgi:hypothetical protein